MCHLSSHFWKLNGPKPPTRVPIPTNKVNYSLTALRVFPKRGKPGAINGTIIF
jgi:hypothetical protein